MNLRVIWIGKTKNPNLSRLTDDYISRIEHFLPLEIVELKEPKNDPDKRVDAEGKRLLGVLGTMDRVVALDPAGKSWTSGELARFVQKHMREEQRRLSFVIGGFGGLSNEVLQRADIRWSLSPLTFTHDLTRLLLLEQIYRALSIIHNLPYSK
jgi:23S rRNA (pseudouridine1915-N3)-methyltransferase